MSHLFSVRLSAQERQTLRVLSQRLERKQGDVLRLLLRRAARRAGVLPDLTQSAAQPAKEGEHVEPVA